MEIMFNKEANIAGAIQTFLNGGYTLDEICSKYDVTLEEVNAVLNPPQITHQSNDSIEETLPNGN